MSAAEFSEGEVQSDIASVRTLEAHVAAAVPESEDQETLYARLMGACERLHDKYGAVLAEDREEPLRPDFEELRDAIANHFCPPRVPEPWEESLKPGDRMGAAQDWQEFIEPEDTRWQDSLEPGDRGEMREEWRASPREDSDDASG